jgi:hypothetical protein
LTPSTESPGYQTPPLAHQESLRALELVEDARAIELLDHGGILSFPSTGAWKQRIEPFVREQGRRRPTWSIEPLEDPARGGTTLRVVGPGARRWLEDAVSRAKPTLGTRLRGRIRLDERFRALTGRARVLPSFFIIGAPRCGTTTLFDTLSRHPSVIPPASKEVAYFNVLLSRGLPWYRSNFPTVWQRAAARRRTGAFATGDATPTYLFHPHVARRIREAVPDARLIALLRDPVQRAYSHYHWAVGMGYELLSFEEAVEREEERTRGELERMLSDESYLSFPRNYLSYLAMGVYVDQLAAWREVFPEDRFLVLSTGELQREPARVLRRTLEFLGLPAAPGLDVRDRNSGSYEPMGEAVQERLRNHFRSHDERLREHLGSDFRY